MKQPAFRLATLLRVRKHELDRAHAALARAVEDCQRWRERRSQSTQQASDAAGQLASQLGRGMGAGRLTIGLDAIEVLRADADLAAREEQAGQALVASAREALQVARSRVRGLEILRDRREAAGRAEADRREQRGLDELGGQLVRRREREA